jgi:hypothetical protein
MCYFIATPSEVTACLAINNPELHIDSHEQLILRSSWHPQRDFAGCEIQIPNSRGSGGG